MSEQNNTNNPGSNNPGSNDLTSQQNSTSDSASSSTDSDVSQNLNSSTGQSSSSNDPKKKQKKPKKPQGPIRWNAIVPFCIFALLVYGYFFLFFDSNMKSALEWVGFKAVGAEINIGTFKSSFTTGKVQISKIEITNAEKPDFNSFELADMRFDLNWDALLRLKFVIEEIAVEGVQFNSKRKFPGKVAPPPPPEENQGPSLVSQLQDKAISKFDEQNKENILGDVSQFLKSGNFDAQIADLQSQLASKKLLEDMNKKWTDKKTEWDGKIKSLPTMQELNDLKSRFGQIKTSGFKTPQELEASLKALDAVLKDADAKNKKVQDVKNSLETDLKSLDQDYKAVDAQIKSDIDTLKSRFKIPKIDAASFAKGLFMGYLTPIMAKVDRYKAMAQKYLPPKYSKMVDNIGKKNAKGATAGKEDAAEDDTIQPHPRADGTTYEFPIAKGYPLFWIQKVSVSSKSNAQADYGDFAGLIKDVTSNQRQVGRPTTLDLKGDFKSMNVSGVKLNAELNNLAPEAVVKFKLGVGSYILNQLELLNSKEGQISIPTSNTDFTANGEIIGFKKYDFVIKNNFKDINFNVKAADQTLNEVLNTTLSAIKSFDLNATVKGEMPKLDIGINSSLGADLQKSFENLLKAKIQEANEKLQAAVNGEIGKLKAQVQQQTDAIKNQVQGEVNKVQNQINEQKKMAEDKVNQAKKDFENQAKSKVEDEAKKKLEELKKKLKF